MWKSHRPALSSRAFTLIELLVVISIFALLIAILLPALSSAQYSAKSLDCMPRIRQLGMAYRVIARFKKTQDIPQHLA
ncbi:MAG: hypothetical protein Kow00105_20330 [Phycisphaeraceae bacterium]